LYFAEPDDSLPFEVLGFCGDDCENDSLLGFEAIEYDGLLPTFLKKLLPPYSRKTF
jgi:hypothetical protein